VVCSVIYEFFYIVKVFIKIKVVKNVLDALFFVLSSILSRIIFIKLNFGDFRFFYFLGFVIGNYIYLNSFHKVIAFLVEIVYNKLYTLFKRLKSKNDRAKKEKGFIGGFIRNDNVNLHNDNRNFISNDNDIRKEKSNRRIRPKYSIFKNTNIPDARRN
jgi:hypothetical protein